MSVILKHICDVCSDEHEGRQVTITMGARKPLAIDVCDKVHAELIQPLIELLEQHGRTEAGSTPNAGRPPAQRTCPITDCPNVGHVYRSKDSFRHHMRDIHGLTPEGLPARTGPYANAAGEGARITRRSTSRTAARFKEIACDIEGCTEVKIGPQGIAAHKRAKHGITGTDREAARAAKKAVA